MSRITSDQRKATQTLANDFLEDTATKIRMLWDGTTDDEASQCHVIWAATIRDEITQLRRTLDAIERVVKHDLYLNVRSDR